MLTTKSKKNNAGKRRQARRSNQGSLVRQSGLPTYAGQLVVRVKVPGKVFQFATGATGLGALNKVLDPTADCTNWTSRYVDMFREYRLLGVDVTFMASFPTSGSTLFWLDEASSYTPTVTEAQESEGVLIQNTPYTGHIGHLTWRSKETQDLQFFGLSTASAILWLKIFTNAADFGATAATYNIQTVRATYLVEFKGLGV